METVGNMATVVFRPLHLFMDGVGVTILFMIIAIARNYCIYVQNYSICDPNLLRLMETRTETSDSNFLRWLILTLWNDAGTFLYPPYRMASFKDSKMAHITNLEKCQCLNKTWLWKDSSPIARNIHNRYFRYSHLRHSSKLSSMTLMSNPYMELNQNRVVVTVKVLLKRSCLKIGLMKILSKLARKVWNT